MSQVQLWKGDFYRKATGAKPSAALDIRSKWQTFSDAESAIAPCEAQMHSVLWP